MNRENMIGGNGPPKKIIFFTVRSVELHHQRPIRSCQLYFIILKENPKYTPGVYASYK